MAQYTVTQEALPCQYTLTQYVSEALPVKVGYLLQSNKNLYMSQQLGNEVERQGQGKQVNYTQDNSFFSKKRRRAALGGI